MYNILVTGAKGQLGSELQDLSLLYPEYEFIFSDEEDLDISNHQEVRKFIAVNSITAIINCAAYTAVDKAETEPTKADTINHLAVENLAKISKSRGIVLIHISTDYVFDGTSNKPYTEEDIPNPQSVYGQTKLDGENAMLKINPAHAIIIRTSWLYSSYGSNFVKTMIRLGKEKKELSIISDQVGSPTYANNLARTILEILPKIENEDVEIYHYANEGICSWYDFAIAIFVLKKMAIKVDPIKSVEFITLAKRPPYSVLNKSKIKETFQIKIPSWEESLARCLRKPEPKLIELPKILDKRGYLTWFENSNQIPFDIEWTYFVYGVPGGEIIGGHAFRERNEFLVVLSGSLDIIIFDGQKETKLSLNRSYYGLFIPNGLWYHMENFATNTFVLVVTSTTFNENDYIRDKGEFLKLMQDEKDSI